MPKRNDKNKKRLRALIGALTRLKEWIELRDLEYDKGRGVDTFRIEQEIHTLESRIKK